MKNDAREVDRRQISVLMDMRPALSGFAGIPQENRLLFSVLHSIAAFDVQGLIQSPSRRLAHGLPKGDDGRDPAHRLDVLSRAVISMCDNGPRTPAAAWRDGLRERAKAYGLALRTLLGMERIRLSRFDPADFGDFVWNALFAKTLATSERLCVIAAGLQICAEPVHTLHRVGDTLRSWLGRPRFARIDTAGVDVFIAQTPYPARVAPGTALVIRYYDAMPVLMPHTVQDKARHQARHFHALRCNVESGAWFACASDATRADLLKMFPAARARAVTLPCMLPDHYVEGDADAKRVASIIGADACSEALRYVLMVSTIEPRKNHARLLAAWEIVRAERSPSLKLVLVGSPGWGMEEITPRLQSWVRRGDLFMLDGISAADMRVLYQHAELTVCPSLAEGFDLTGVEAMACGGRVLASDIAVHREVYGEAAAYFDPWSTSDLVERLTDQLKADLGPARHIRREIAARYSTNRVLPSWQTFLKQVAAEGVKA